MDFKLVGLKKQTDPKQDFTTTQASDGTQTVNAGGYFSTFLIWMLLPRLRADLIRRYREIAIHPECDMAVEDIVNEAIVSNEMKDAVRINLEGLSYGKDIRRKIEHEFSEILRLLNFNVKGHDIFRRWYVDGRIFFQKLIDRKDPTKGITELKYIDPRKIKKIREVKKVRPNGKTDLTIVDEYIEYYLFNEKGFTINCWFRY